MKSIDLVSLLTFVAVCSPLLASAAPQAAVAGTARGVTVCKVASAVALTGVTSSVIIRDAKAAFDYKTNKGVDGAPWLPICAKLASLAEVAKCSACQATAGATVEKALGGCAAASIPCAELEPACVMACSAFAWATFYSTVQKCYCLYADCSDKTKNAAALVQAQAPQVYIAGAAFNVRMAPGGGTVGPQVDYQLSGNNVATWKNMPVCEATRTLKIGLTGKYGSVFYGSKLAARDTSPLPTIES